MVKTEQLNVLLCENIAQSADRVFKGFNVVRVDGALSEEQLIQKISEKNIHILGVRSKTRVTERVLVSAPQLIAVGCFCIGTDQVDMDAATRHGVAVFNSPFSNTRSVAELTIAEVVMLARQAVQRSMDLHSAGKWNKSAEHCMEVRRKTIGIVGYGHIGPQVGLLAESFGMKVVFYDIIKKLPFGNARQLFTLEELLKISDFVTLHVPDTPLTRNMISFKQLELMPEGSYLLNLSRGTVVDIPALLDALKRRRLAGAAVDVFPKEPESGKDIFESELRGVNNVILTPHMGGSTEEAQWNIGLEVSEALAAYAFRGSSTGSCNFPEFEPISAPDSFRVVSIHWDIPGVLSEINGVTGKLDINIKAQTFNTRNGIGYLVLDTDQELSEKDIRRIESIKVNDVPINIKTRPIQKAEVQALSLAQAV